MMRSTLQRIHAHFESADRKILTLLQTIPLDDIRPRAPSEYFESLCREIIGQQLSGNVADVIFARFETLVGKKKVAPEVVLALSKDALRGIGMSWSKVRYICDLADKVKNKEVILSRLPLLDDAGVIRELTKIKGIGPWTAEMFLMFTLGREDVFSLGDLGLKRGIQKLYGLPKEPTVKQMQKISSRWSPYRTIAARLLWRYKDGA